MLWVQSTTNNYVRAKHKLQSNSKLLIPEVFVFLKLQLKFYSERKTRKTITCFGADLYSVSTQHGNLHPAGWPILFCGSAQEPVLATANTGKTRERFGKNAGEWTGRIEICKEDIPGSIEGVDTILVIHLPKKDNLKQCQNYHIVSLISHSSKIMLRVILSHSRPRLGNCWQKKKQVLDQAGAQ